MCSFSPHSALRFVSLYSLLSTLYFLAVATDAGAALSPRARNKAIVEQTYVANLGKYKGDSDTLVLPGLVADRKRKRIRLQAEATALGMNAPIEFLLIAESSGHDYESIAVSFAKPSDIHKALVFIGMKPGRPTNANKVQLWPKGERVLLTLEWKGGRTRNAERGIKKKHSELRSVRAESLLLDRRTGKPLPADGFVFVGSLWREPVDTGPVVAGGDRGSGRVYAADQFGPQSIASYYNDPETVLDVPRRAPQREVYNFQVPNVKYQFMTNELIEVIIEPEYKDGKQRVIDLRLQVTATNATRKTGAAADLVFMLQETNGNSLVENAPFKNVLAAFEKLVADGHDPFVYVEFDGELTLSVISDFCPVLANIDNIAGIRVDAPPPGHLYYRAFIPNETFRNRKNRISQPWELRIAEKGEKVTGTITLIDEVRNHHESGRWKERVRKFDASTAEAVRQVLVMKDEYGAPAGLSVIFIFAPGAMRYKTLMSLAAHLPETHPTVFVYLD